MEVGSEKREAWGKIPPVLGEEGLGRAHGGRGGALLADAEEGSPVEWESQVEVPRGRDFCRAGWRAS